MLQAKRREKLPHVQHLTNAGGDCLEFGFVNYAGACRGESFCSFGGCRSAQWLGVHRFSVDRQLGADGWLDMDRQLDVDGWLNMDGWVAWCRWVAQCRWEVYGMCVVSQSCVGAHTCQRGELRGSPKR